MDRTSISKSLVELEGKIKEALCAKIDMERAKARIRLEKLAKSKHKESKFFAPEMAGYIRGLAKAKQIIKTKHA